MSSGPTSRRPASAARARSQPAPPLTVPRGLSRRAAVLAALLLVVGLAVAPFLRDAVNQDAEIAALEREVAQRRDRVAELEGQLARWDDPAFVRAQARERLTYVMPGEVGYVVLDGPQDPDVVAEGAAGAGEASAERPWFGVLWESVQEADRATGVGGEPADPAPAPVPAPEP
ncbi:FtsB family cell division protein [Thalassiella azotivora]